MAVRIDKLGDKANELINRLIADGEALPFFKDTCVHIIDDTPYTAADLREFISLISYKDVQNGDTYPRSEELAIKYAYLLEKSSAAHVLFDDPIIDRRVAAAISMLISVLYTEEQLCKDIERFALKQYRGGSDLQ